MHIFIFLPAVNRLLNAVSAAGVPEGHGCTHLLSRAWLGLRGQRGAGAGQPAGRGRRPGAAGVAGPASPRAGREMLGRGCSSPAAGSKGRSVTGTRYSLTGSSAVLPGLGAGG